MKKYDLSNIEVLGYSVLSFYSALGNLRTFAENTLTELQFGTKNSKGFYEIIATEWYPITLNLAFQDRVMEKIGHRTLLNVGKKIPETAIFPSGMDTIEKALAGINIGYYLNHRKNGKVMFDANTGILTPGIGTYHFEHTPGKKEGIMICENPYRSELDEGILSGMVKRFEPNASVSLDTSKPTRRNGSDSCTFLIRW